MENTKNLGGGVFVRLYPDTRDRVATILLQLSRMQIAPMLVDHLHILCASVFVSTIWEVCVEGRLYIAALHV